MSGIIPDAVADALGRVVADVRHGFERDLAALASEHRAQMAELRLSTDGLMRTLEQRADAVFARIEERISSVKDGADGQEGPQGPAGDPGLDGKEGPQGPRGEPGADGRGIEAVEIDASGNLLAKFTDGEQITLGRVVGADGKDGEPGPKGDRGEVGPAGKEGPEGPEGRPGKDGLDGALGPQGERGLPGERGDPGEKGDPGDMGRQGEHGLPGKDGLDGAAGRDGVGMAGAFINRSGELILTLTDGTTRDLGMIVGKDGAPGADGPAGRDGLDGVGFDDLEMVDVSERVFVIRAARGANVKEWKFCKPGFVDRGVYKAGQSYEAGDAVTFGGSLWIAQREAKEKPGTGDAWRLAVKHGRDGRDGEKGDKGDPGLQGRPGRDWTAEGPR
jgi:integrin beta 3